MLYKVSKPGWCSCIKSFMFCSPNNKKSWNKLREWVDPTSASLTVWDMLWNVLILRVAFETDKICGCCLSLWFEGTFERLLYSSSWVSRTLLQRECKKIQANRNCLTCDNLQKLVSCHSSSSHVASVILWDFFCGCWFWGFCVVFFLGGKQNT